MLFSDKVRTGKVHVAAIVEAEGACPNSFDIWCDCGWYENTLWGMEHAKTLFRDHKAANGANPIVIPLL